MIVDAAGGARPSATTFAELEALANRLAHALLALGARRGDRIVWCGPNSLEVIATIHASRKAGLTSVPLSYRFNADEMQYVIDNSDATLVRGRRRAGAARRRRCATSCRRCAACSCSAATPPPGCALVGRRRRAAAARSPPGRRRRPRRGVGRRHDDLHVGHHGEAQGRAAHRHRPPSAVGALLAASSACSAPTVHLTTGPLYHSGPLAFASVRARRRRHHRGAAQVRPDRVAAPGEGAPRHQHVHRADPAEAHRRACRPTSWRAPTCRRCAR